MIFLILGGSHLGLCVSCCYGSCPLTSPLHSAYPAAERSQLYLSIHEQKEVSLSSDTTV